MDLGIDYAEVDVQRTREGRLILMHDKTVDRTTCGTGFVGELTYDEIRRLDAGGGERVPLLAEALAVANGKIGLVLESITPGIGSAVFREAERSGFEGPIIFASFHHADILAIRDLDPSAKTMALLEGVLVTGASFATAAGATFTGLSIESVSRAFIASLQEAGLQVLVYTVNDRPAIQYARSLGVDGVISDFPDRI
jgi:glycerophosphoryl diester phosphodiesterase